MKGVLFDKLSMINLVVLLVLPVAVAAAYAQQRILDSNSTTTLRQASLSPTEYFGGTDHDTYTLWYETNYAAKYFAGSTFLYQADADKNINAKTPTNGVAVHWYVDKVFQTLHIGIATRAEDGWVAFGISEAGGTYGTDLVIYETAKPFILSDTHVLDSASINLDVCQDWVFINSINENGFLIVEGRRLLYTGDLQDHPIINDSELFIPTQRVVAAWGTGTPTMLNSDPALVKGAVRWYSNGDENVKFNDLVTSTADGYFDLIANKGTSETLETSYVNSCFSWDNDIVPQGVPSNTNIYVMAMETILDKDGESSVYHAIVTASRTPPLEEVQNCTNSSADDYVLYQWRPGTTPFVFPADVDVAIPFGPHDGVLQNFRLHVRYSSGNPLSLLTNLQVRLHYKLAAPTYEAGILYMGGKLSKSEGIQMRNGTTSRYDFTCRADCSSLVLQEPVTVIGEHLYMQYGGASAAQYQIRNDEIIRHANLNFFDYHETDAFAVRQQPYQIHPGDSFRTSCYYENKAHTDLSLTSDETLCISALLYYPAHSAPWACTYDLPLSACNATLTISTINFNETNSTSKNLIHYHDDNDGPNGSHLPATTAAAAAVAARFERTFGYNYNNITEIDQCPTNTRNIQPPITIRVQTSSGENIIISSPIIISFFVLFLFFGVVLIG